MEMQRKAWKVNACHGMEWKGMGRNEKLRYVMGRKDMQWHGKSWNGLEGQGITISQYLLSQRQR